MERKIAYLIALGLIVIQLVMLPRLAVATEITNPPGTVPREVRFSGVLQDAAGALQCAARRHACRRATARGVHIE